MYRLLIIDNEEYVVDGLVDLFSSDKHPTLDVQGVYSAAEALNVLMATSMDIVITDIRMPGMTGLELQKIIAARWPHCKAIFLSGYDDFSYAQEAIRGGSVNYILKTETDDVIIDAVYQAIELTRKERETQDVIEEARKQVRQALPALQREFVESLLIGDKTARASLSQQLEQLAIPLSADKPLFAAVAKVDEWPSDYSHYSRSLLLYAVQNISNEYLSMSSIYYSFVYDHSKIVWLVQSKAEPWLEELRNRSMAAMTSHFLYGTFECVQSSCLDLLHLPLSFAIGRGPVDWHTLDEEMDRLLEQLQGTVKKQQLYMEPEQSKDGGEPAKSPLLQHEVFKHYEHLGYCLDHKDREEFTRKLEFLIRIGDKAHKTGQGLTCLQLASSLFSILLAALEKLRTDDLPESIDDIVQTAKSGNLISDWEKQRLQLRALGDFIFQMQLHAEEKEENRVVQSIHAYLDANLGGDLSLKTMALAMGHNPSYLSRLYKQKAGKGLSETITERKLVKAKELLANSEYRIQDVSQAIGFLSDHYFYRFFKKATRLTPQEYRDRLNVNGREPDR
ncbi:response regulator transcription factor [Gorillibacterium massiliense]|uniref:response regulator transcription factor n=1 Tax=Gorillibacterium massiliense TaxID=1280390 RepID=UPI0004B86F3D|nr:response regulator [Gorillibacterium massiliense]